MIELNFERLTIGQVNELLKLEKNFNDELKSFKADFITDLLINHNNNFSISESNNEAISLAESIIAFCDVWTNEAIDNELLLRPLKDNYDIHKFKAHLRRLGFDVDTEYLIILVICIQVHALEYVKCITEKYFELTKAV